MNVAPWVHFSSIVRAEANKINTQLKIKMITGVLSRVV